IGCILQTQPRDHLRANGILKAHLDRSHQDMIHKRQVTLKRIAIRGFRSCRSTNLLPNRSISALIGRNGSGKSNLLKAIFLLARVARSSYRQYYDEKSATQCKLEAEFQVRGSVIGYRASLKLSSETGGREQILSAEEQWNFRQITKKDEWLTL